ncbi:MAG: aldehyde dehydrogenase EutE [Gemmataceae bacterium]|nr:aldehyde dehydrogenase EutE [Gemmataceae bacterium]
MQVTDDLVRSVVQQVLAKIGVGGSPVSQAGKCGADGVFQEVESAVAAAAAAQKLFERKGLEERRKAVACIRKICLERAEELGREEFEETKIGRLVHKIEKLKIIADRIPGVEFLKTEAFSGENGITLQEYAPFGVIGVITPVTHSLPTLACNAINMLASGNSMVVNPHPSGARIACKGVRLFNLAIRQAIGIENLITIIEKPTLESAQAIFDHREVRMLCVTGGPAVGRAALRSPKRAVVAGPGNPPVVVDETADLDNAAKSIIAGAAYDNNLLCIGEKEVFAVDAIFEELLQAMGRYKAVRLNAQQVEALTQAAMKPSEDKKYFVPAKELLGQDAAILAKKIGLQVPADTELLFGETKESNPFVPTEQMMPFVPFVRVPDAETAIALAKKHEHGFKHTSIIHSRNVETITRMGREMDTTLFVQNGPSTAGLGSGGEGYLSFSIATPTGEGVTTPLTFTRQRRSTTVGALRVI